MWENLKFSLFSSFFKIFSENYKICENFIADFLYCILVMLMLFPGFDKLSAPKNTNATFSESEEVD